MLLDSNDPLSRQVDVDCGSDTGFDDNGGRNISRGRSYQARHAGERKQVSKDEKKKENAVWQSQDDIKHFTILLIKWEMDAK